MLWTEFPCEVQTPKEAFRSISWKFHGKAGVSKLKKLVIHVPYGSHMVVS
jgi:hypothetical protein